MVDFVFEQLDNSKAEDLVKINLKGRTSFADFLIIATGTSTRHVMALADSLAKDLKKRRLCSQSRGKKFRR
ncbi:MAG: RsfS/YbeB/iojap family protein [Alphaproteobacteria bacterium]|nr:RsfS/YbeB/iojap family protein [Alphaproteobacteria bacterium]